MKLELKGHCYVLVQGDWLHPIVYRQHELVWYPERSMTLYERHNYRPYVKSVVTEDAWVIGCYPREKVFVVGDDGRWDWPDRQTYGASHNQITLCLLGIQSTIPAMTNDGGEEMRRVMGEYKKLIAKANKVYKL